ncbi:predicted protein [Sclerotinia sclerotiorum 1980 UF-70]|uniref:Uncharacterized protein n=1 Tax=Sclerotinia sclerotiorum (strain ATCC 18683 / 1980 / Ss-1) TaxID=665079 RepID=A7ESW9_SCLS1|nr:predicted protein [Sclerotinia sclerotiorum 1980 UF-70]EDN92561.1 predicted protein [Sclerotinia sclerotiorum 1980 UF-70]
MCNMKSPIDDHVTFDNLGIRDLLVWISQSLKDSVSPCYPVLLVQTAIYFSLYLADFDVNVQKGVASRSSLDL